MTSVSLRIDLIQGTIEIECEAADFESVISSAERVMGKFAEAKQLPSTKPYTPEPVSDGDERDAEDASSDGNTTKQKAKSRRKKGGGHANWKVVDNLLSEAQRADLKNFYNEKAPGKQNDQVAVLAYKLTELLGRDGFDGNEIHTAFQAVGVKTPANLTGVFGNMTGEDLGRIVEKKWTPNFKSNDLVKHDLPVASKKK